MIQNNLLNSCQSGFRPNDSCINQLISITHNIYRAFYASSSLEAQGVFLDLSKAFDKVWHEGLLYKLKKQWDKRKFLLNRRQRVVLNHQSSSWLSIRAGVPQESVLGPLFFSFILTIYQKLNSLLMILSYLAL